jgi:hypothetical protein
MTTATCPAEAPPMPVDGHAAAVRAMIVDRFKGIATMVHQATSIRFDSVESALFAVIAEDAATLLRLIYSLSTNDDTTTKIRAALEEILS